MSTPAQKQPSTGALPGKGAVSTRTNQDGVLAQWRADAAEDDPAFYTVRQMLGRAFVWMSVCGNVGWYAPEVKDGEVIGIRSIALPQPTAGETAKERAVLNYAFKLITPKQCRKLAHLLANQVQGRPSTDSIKQPD